MAKLAYDQLQTLVKVPSQLAADGPIYSYLEPAFKKHLLQYLQVFEQLREKEGKRFPAQVLPALPYGINSLDWILRLKSVQVIKKLFHRKRYPKILEISSWNGWLSKYLQPYTSQLITLDYFSDAQDGLKAVQHYPEPWTAIQCNLERPDIFNTGFDIIVINHSLPYTGNPLAMAQLFRTMLTPGGKVIILGIPFFRNPERHRYNLEQAQQHYLTAFNFHLYINPVKGWLDMHDRKQLKDHGYRLYPYPGLWNSKTRSLFSAYSPIYQYAVYQA